MASTHISSLTDAGVQDPKDKLQLQRQVLGIWTDYHTNIETYFGPVQTVVYEWDGQAPFGENITCPSGKLLLLVQGAVVFTPGAIPTNTNINILINSVGASTSYAIDLNDGPDGLGGLMSPLDDPIGNPYDFIDQELIVSSSWGGTPYAGSTRIIIQYLLIDAV